MIRFLHFVRRHLHTDPLGLSKFTKISVTIIQSFYTFFFVCFLYVVWRHLMGSEYNGHRISSLLSEFTHLSYIIPRHISILTKCFLKDGFIYFGINSNNAPYFGSIRHKLSPVPCITLRISLSEAKRNCSRILNESVWIPFILKCGKRSWTLFIISSSFFTFRWTSPLGFLGWAKYGRLQMNSNDELQFSGRSVGKP